MNRLIDLPEEIKDFSSAMVYGYRRREAITAALIAPFWIFPCAKMGNLHKNGLKAIQSLVKVDGLTKKEAELLDSCSSLLTTEAGVPRQVPNIEVEDAQDILKRARKELTAISKSTGITEDELILAGARSTMPTFRELTIASPYSSILDPTLLDAMGRYTSKIGREVIGLGATNALTVEDLYCYLAFFRYRSMANINMVYRILENIKIVVGDNAYAVNDIAMMSPSQILHEVRSSVVKISPYTIRRAEDFEIPKSLRKDLKSHERSEIAIVEGPAAYVLYIGRTMIVSGNRRAFEENSIDEKD